MNVLSLCAGIGGLDLGLERAGMTTVGQVEIDPFCQRVLAKHWPKVPKHDDVRTAIRWWRSQQRPEVHVVAAGFPCQPVSLAGRQLAQADERWLWPAVAAVIRELRPRYVVLENVPGLLVRGVGDVLGDLAAVGYDTEWDCVPAAAVGAPHLRDRVFIVAYPAGERRGQGRPRGSVGDGADRETEWPETLADPDRTGSPRRAGEKGRRPSTSWRVESQRLGSRLPWHRPTPGSHWSSEPDVGRVAHGVPHRVDRLRSLGNAVVPQVAEHIGRLVMASTQPELSEQDRREIAAETLDDRRRDAAGEE